MEDAPVRKAAKGTTRRGVHLTREMTLVINAQGSTRILYEIVPTSSPQTGPCLAFYDVSKGRKIGERRCMMVLSVSGATHLMRYMPMLINAARRKAATKTD